MLPPADLERLAVAAFLRGLDDEACTARERAAERYLELGDWQAAAGCVFWLGFHLSNRGEFARSRGWLARLRRAIPDNELHNGRIPGLLALSDAAMTMLGGDPAAALAMFETAGDLAAVGVDPDTFVLYRFGRASCLAALGRPTEAVQTLDEPMVQVVAGAVAPQLVGFAYCAVVGLCMSVYDLRRAREWTKALSGWCDDQVGLVPYRGSCLVHRAEILQLRGDLADALLEAAAVRDGPEQRVADQVTGAACYRIAEIERVRGDLGAAERAYQQAGRLGAEVQPGLALLRAAQGRFQLAAAGLDRALAEHPPPAHQPLLHAARIEIALSTGDLTTARTARDRLDELATALGTPYLRAMAAQCAGAVALADDDPREGLARLRFARALWQELQAPYELARTRELIAVACQQLGDLDTAAIESDAARSALNRLGIRAPQPDLHFSRAAGTVPLPPSGSAPAIGAPDDSPLSAREAQVLRLVATGATNRVIADTLILSEKTVARHLSNIFGKIGVPSRAAATSYAFRHGFC